MCSQNIQAAYRRQISEDVKVQKENESRGEKEMTEYDQKKGMDIVDAQVHIGPGSIGETLAAMDALGIRGIVVDEYWLDNVFSYDPHEVLEGGVIRPVCPTAELASLRYPERFSWVLRINRMDPEYKAQVRKVRESSGGRAVRLIPGMDPREVQAFAAGEYDSLLGEVCENGLPLFLHLPDQPEMIDACAKRFPNLRIIVDHCGLFSNDMRAMNPAAAHLTDEEQFALYDRVLALSDCPNVGLKWAHYSTMFRLPAYPGVELQPILRRTISAFGMERLMWASDFSVNQSGDTWGELLYGIRGNADLTDRECAALLGETARSWLDWKEGIDNEHWNTDIRSVKGDDGRPAGHDKSLA